LYPTIYRHGPYENRESARNFPLVSSPNRLAAFPSQGGNRSRDSPNQQPLTYKIGKDEYYEWFLGDMEIPDPPRIGQQELRRHQLIQLDCTLNDAMINCRNDSGRI